MKVFENIFCFVSVILTAHVLAADSPNTLVIQTDQGVEKISRHIYGHFAEHLGHCIYGGIWVGEDSPIANTRGIRNDVVQALRDINIPNLRWPGGCFADEYHWMDGIGPSSERPSMINTHWGGVTEDNSFGTHEFMDLCEQLGCEPVIVGNLGSGTVQEMSQWVEYLNSGNVSPMTDLRKRNGREKPWKVKFWGLGNENWGCGGSMTPEFYADQMRRFSTYCRNYGDNRLYKVACGPNSDNYEWMDVLMREGINRRMFLGISLHYYTVCHTWRKKGSATGFDESEWFLTLSKTLQMDELIRRHTTIMDRYDPDKRIGLIVDEWGNWHDVEPGTNPRFLYQQNTLRDAMAAAVNLDIFNKYCDRVKMANIAQTVNVLQAMILTKDAQMVKTPSYYVFKMYKVHHDATLLPSELKCEQYDYGDEKIPALSASVSLNDGGIIHISLSNINPNKSLDVNIELRGLEKLKAAEGEILTAKKMDAYNDFGVTEEVHPAEFKGFKFNGASLSINMPAKSIVMLAVK